ncbi:NACHT domain-containing protein [Streptomyces sp. NBC_00287]|uniref:NACHT domain-containing protein n=1 Tax=Streptomyces sp. NBC_00287 TaxID=2975702 RepID=UPI002E2B0CD1|nr:NACHT domain-containing protein [Streptomyces sp. NBC_00287]
MSRNTVRWPWLIGAVGAAALVTVVALVIGSGAQAAATSLSVLISATAGLFSWSWHRSRPAAPATRTELEQAAEALAAMVRRQWTEEAAAQGLLDPHPLAVRWRSGQTEAGDHVRMVGRTVSGRSDDIAAFAAAYRALPRRRLVVLGEPGAGKTALAILLVRELLRDPQPGEPVPVLLDLAPWNPRKEPLLDWMARRIHEDYPALRNHETYGRDAARKLVAEGRVLPVLDGLDELPAELRLRALAAVNHAIAVHGPLILTSRQSEYHRMVTDTDVVTAAAVVVADPVGAADVAEYLRSVVPPRRSAAWQPVLDELTRRPEGPVAQALSVPLNVWLARTVYALPASDPGELIRFTDASSLQHHLLDALVPAVFSPEPTAVDPSVPDVRRTAATRWHPDDARSSLSFLASHIKRQGTDDIAWWELHRALRPDPAGPLSGPVAGAVVGLGAGCMAGDYFHWALSPLARFACFVVITLATAVGATVVIRLAYDSGDGRRHTLGEFASRAVVGGIALLPVAVVVGAAVEHWASAATRATLTFEVGVAPYTWARAGVAWLLFMAVLSLGALCAAMLRRRSAASPRSAGSRRAQVRRILLLAVLFWLGAELGGFLAYGSIRQVTGGQVTDLSFLDPSEALTFVNRRAVFRTCVFLLIVTVIAGLDLPGASSRPTRLDLRASGRVLVGMLPACLARGLLLGTTLGVALAFVSPWGWMVPWSERILAAGAFGAFFGALLGLGLAVLRWARVPADLEQETPRSTLRGERTVAIALMLFAVVPPLGKWIITSLGHLTSSDTVAVLVVGAWLETLEANLGLGLAAGLAGVSSTAYFKYREVCLRLASAKRLPRHPLSFMEDARLLSVLRRVGPVYQFCHDEFKDRIVDGGDVAADLIRPGPERV